MPAPRTTRALVLRQDGFATGPMPAVPAALEGYLDLAEMPLPALAAGQVLVEVGLAPVNPSDLFFIQGAYGQPRIRGNAAGFEGMGRVVAGQGPAAEALIGRRVAFLGTVTGSWAAHAVTDAALCIPLHDALRDEDGAALIVNPLTAVALVERVRAAGARAFVLNAAGSQLGRLILGLARDDGLAALAMVRRPGAAQALQALGAAEVLVAAAPVPDAALLRAIRAHKPRVLLDAVGDQLAAEVFFAMPSGARWISYGKMSDEAPRLGQMGQFIFMDKHIEGFWLARWLPAQGPEARAAAIEQVQARFVDGRWQTLIAETLPLDHALAGILPVLARGTGKVMIAP